MRRTLGLWVLAVAVVAVLAWAWVDGGREPVRPISQPVTVPEPAR